MSADLSSIDPSEIIGLSTIEEAVLDSASLPSDEVRKRYLLIGDALYVSAQALRLDEDFDNLLVFAVGVAEEMSDVLLRQAIALSNRRHWQYRPLMLKSDEGNDPNSEVIAKDDQSNAMVDCLLYHLRKDDRYAAGANALMASQG
ncbi:hypothetical protein [Lysobacter capsici]|uniref:hypothetical protein n=1 Tax=Lysobacter capsici TaxID=435897 RepID=UPI0006277F78|nr:hypothetical protein [Lysobacter capsici]